MARTFDTGMVSVSKSLEQAKGQPLRIKSTKSGESRSFEVDDFALDALREHRQQQDADRKMFGRDYQRHNLIFCQPNGAFYSPDRCGARVKELMVKAGLTGVSLHSLRHANASVMLSAGVPLPVVSERLGHADQTVTLAIYTHVMPKDRRAASRAFLNALSEVISEERKTDSPRSTLKKCPVIEAI
jgi:integrase